MRTLAIALAVDALSTPARRAQHPTAAMRNTFSTAVDATPKISSATGVAICGGSRYRQHTGSRRRESTSYAKQARWRARWGVSLGWHAREGAKAKSSR